MSADTQFDFNREYTALCGGRGIAELTDWSSVCVTGIDRKNFLHSFCTNDVKRLEPDNSCEAFFTNAKGKIVGHGVISCREDELVVVGAPGQASRLIEHLDRYVIREDVRLADATSTRSYWIVPHELQNAEELLAVTWSFFGTATALVELASSDRVATIGKYMNDRFIEVGPAALNAARIEAGLPLFGLDFDEGNLPQEIGRDTQAISFKKGCYLGQETIARIDALGHVNQRIVGLRFRGNDVPIAGTILTRNGAEAGRVTSAAYSPALGAPLALAMVRRGANVTGTRLDSTAGECEVIKLPIAAE